MRFSFVASPVVVIAVVLSFSWSAASVHAQTSGCTYDPPNYIYFCGSGEYRIWLSSPPSGSGPYIFGLEGVNCYPGYQELIVYTGQCVQTKNIAPDVLRNLWKRYPEGNILMASCSGEMIPIPPLRTAVERKQGQFVLVRERPLWTGQ